jgi:hypothetical protein
MLYEWDPFVGSRMVLTYKNRRRSKKFSGARSRVRPSINQARRVARENAGPQERKLEMRK